MKAIVLTGALLLAASSGYAATHMRADNSGATAYAQYNVTRGPQTRPHGWSEGRKKGWGCKVGTTSCRPPGLRHH